MNRDSGTDSANGGWLRRLVRHHINDKQTKHKMNITDQEIEKLKASKSEQEWNSTCDEIKRARGGQYPPDWWPRMMLSGLIAKIQATWQ